MNSIGTAPLPANIRDSRSLTVCSKEDLHLTLHSNRNGAADGVAFEASELAHRSVDVLSVVAFVRNEVVLQLFVAAAQAAGQLEEGNSSSLSGRCGRSSESCQS